MLRQLFNIFSILIEKEFQKFNNGSYVVALERTGKNRIKYALLMNGHQNWEDYENTKVYSPNTNLLANKLIICFVHN